MVRFTLAGCVAALLLTGCGGGGGASTNPKLTIKWPDTTRNFEATPESRSARIILTEVNDRSKTQTWVVRRPAGSSEVTQTYQAPNRIVNGDCYLVAEFDITGDGTGPTYARLDATVEIQQDGSLAKDGGFPLDALYAGASEVFLNMEIANDTLLVNEEEPLMTSAVLYNNSLGAIPIGALEYSVEGDAVTIVNGVIRGVREGRAKIEAKFRRRDATVITESRDVVVVPSITASRSLPIQGYGKTAKAAAGSLYFHAEPLMSSAANPTSLKKMNLSTGQVSSIFNQPFSAFDISQDGTIAWVCEAATVDNGTKARYRKIDLATSQVLETVDAEIGVRASQIVINPENNNDFFAFHNFMPTASGTIRYRNGSLFYFGEKSGFGASFVASNTIWANTATYRLYETAQTGVSSFNLSPSSSEFVVNDGPNDLFNFDNIGVQPFGDKVINTNTFALYNLSTGAKLSDYQDLLLNDRTAFLSRKVTATDATADLAWIGIVTPGRMSGDKKITDARCMVIRAVRSSDLAVVASATIELPEGSQPERMFRTGNRGLAIVSNTSVVIVNSAPGL
jgi:hypothetical protein